MYPSLHASSACGQRGANEHESRTTRAGGRPGMPATEERMCAVGTAARSACVYGWRGCRATARESASSMISPAYMTASLSATVLRSERSWLT